ncbi:MAG: hypothetical protein OIN88_10460 [Candidatus Methanoperedens sp.]|nr:hypothetical protein [Candidatus Methanoperedens sp.]
MEFGSISTKLSREEITLLKTYCEKKGVTPSAFIRSLIQRELKVSIPQNVAGKNRVHYNKERDTFSWSVDLDSGKVIEVMSDVSPGYLEDLSHILEQGLDERWTFIRKNKKDSVPVPSKILRGEKR